MIFLFPSRLKELRQSMNLHQEALASLLSVDRSTISLMRIADVFGVSTDYLLGRTKQLSFDEFDLDGEDIAALRRMAFALSEKNKRIHQMQEH